MLAIHKSHKSNRKTCDILFSIQKTTAKDRFLRFRLEAKKKSANFMTKKTHIEHDYGGEIVEADEKSLIYTRNNV